MKRDHHIPLFHPRLVRQRAQAVSPERLLGLAAVIAPFIDHLRRGVLDETKETSLHGGFLERIFGDVLGYRTMARASDGAWDLVAEKTLQKGSADAALGRFSQGRAEIVAPIELKGSAQYLEQAKGRALTPIQQAWDYANRAPKARWILVSNYRETRLYAKSRGTGAYEVFWLEDLATEAGLRRFVALLGRDAVLGAGEDAGAPLDEMLLASDRTEREVTAKLYREYRELRAALYAELRQRHSNIRADELLGYAQTILDRVLFMAFAEDRALLPPATLAKAFEHRDPYHPKPVWLNFVALFAAIDRGSPTLGIAAYNGGLFRSEPEIDELDVSDEMCERFKRLGEYDFAEDVSVDVLGHVFEQSITDLEDLRREAAGEWSTTPAAPAGTQKSPSKRRVEGIFYTPPFVTAYLVRETLGRVFRELWEAASGQRGNSKRDQILSWQTYQDALRGVRVLDPACGSGAFLIAAFDALAAEFERTNRALAELRGDTAHAGDLFDLSRTVLNENLFGIDKSAESVEITRLSLWLKTAEKGKKLTFIDRNIRHGNSVVSDPLVDPVAFDWAIGRTARTYFEEGIPPEGESKDTYDARWRAGFDVVIGNPPYVRQELLGAYKEHWKRTFDLTFDGTADLFVYFFERGLRVLKPGGRLGFIVSNKWLRGGYAERLRRHLGRDCTIESIVDFGHAPVFPDADAFPCIITVRKAAPAPTHSVRVTQYPRELLGRESLAGFVESNAFELPQSTLESGGWSLEPPAVRALLEKLRTRGTPLRSYAGVKPFYGVKTGCNEAFLVDQATKERLCREDPRSAELLKKYLRGQDVARWSPVWAGLWMIFTRRGVNIDEYPAIKAHLTAFRSQLEPCPKDYSGSKWAGRKAGNYKWFEIQDSVEYWELFEKPKLLYPDIMWRADFCLAGAGSYANNTIYLLSAPDRWLAAALNSPAMWTYLWRTAQHGKDEALRMFGGYVVTLPIPTPTEVQRARVEECVEALVALTARENEALAGVLDVLRVEYGIEAPGNALADFPAMASDAFVAEVRKRRPRSTGPMAPAALKHLRALYESEVPPLLRARAEARALETVIAAQVHAAWGLTPAELALLHETAPPRMPPGLVPSVQGDPAAPGPQPSR
jgi:SAM-dependent methyltransferase